MEQPVQNPGESAENSAPASSDQADVATEVLQSVAVDPVQERLALWAEEASASPGAQGIRDIDALENLLDLTGAHPAGDSPAVWRPADKVIFVAARQHCLGCGPSGDEETRRRKEILSGSLRAVPHQSGDWGSELDATAAF